MPDSYYYYDMKLISFGYDKNFQVHISISSFIEPSTQKPLALYQLETVNVLIIDNNAEANSYMCLQPRKDLLDMTEENYMSLIASQLTACKYTGHENLCK